MARGEGTGMCRTTIGRCQMAEENRSWGAIINQDVTWGLAGSGIAGKVRIEVDEATSAPGSWELCLSAGGLDLRFPIEGPATVSNILDFAKAHYGKVHGDGKCQSFSEVASLNFDLPGNYDIWISKDGERPDRFHFVIMRDDLRIGIDLHDPEVSDLILAMERLQADLET